MKPVAPAPPSDALTRSYLVAGIPCAVTASSSILEVVEDTYGAFRSRGRREDAYVLRVEPRAGRLVLNDSEGRERPCEDETDAAFAVIEGVVRHVTASLSRHGIYAIHAASLVSDGAGIIICGRSRSGKTTLALALVAAGFGFLSDEFALSAPDAQTINPYRRGVHIRPGTPELVPELAFLNSRPQHSLSGGFQWTMRVDELELLFPSCLSGPARLAHVVFLGARTGRTESALEPLPKGVAAIELLRSTTATPSDFDGVMTRMTSLVESAACVRLHPGRFASSVKVVSELARKSDG